MDVVSPASRPVTRRQFFVAAGAFGVALAVAGCGGGDADGPPGIVPGRSQCDQCHMIITELRFAGAYRTANGTERRFDDIGDMVEYAQQNDEVEGTQFWVFDYDTEDPLDAVGATFVRSDSFFTPMDWALAAFADATAASDFVAEWDGEVLGWTDVQDLVESGRSEESHTG